MSLSFKDRAAVLPGGQRPDACYWFDAPHRPVRHLDLLPRPARTPGSRSSTGAGRRTAGSARTGRGCGPTSITSRYSGPDDVAGEGTGVCQGRTFPHPLPPAGRTSPAPTYYDALYNSPFGNDLLLDLVKRAIDAERLGRHDVPDLLCVSFSCNDPVGHTWGPDSQEVLDVTLRSDLIVKDLLAYLDAQVGQGQLRAGADGRPRRLPAAGGGPGQGKEAGRASSRTC